MKRLSLSKCAAAAALCAFSGAASADLTAAGTWTGNVGLSVDGIGSNFTPVGDVQAFVPVGATILQAYLYSAGTPSPWYAQSPTTLADYNGAGITLAGNVVSNFDTLVGATSTRADIGAWYTARADVTSLVQSLTAGAATGATHGRGIATTAAVASATTAAVATAMTHPRAGTPRRAPVVTIAAALPTWSLSQSPIAGHTVGGTNGDVDVDGEAAMGMHAAVAFPPRNPPRPPTQRMNPAVSATTRDTRDRSFIPASGGRH